MAQGYGTLMSEVYALLERAAPSVGLGLWVREYLVLCLNCSLCDLCLSNSADVCVEF